MDLTQQMKALHILAFNDSNAYADFFFGVRYNKDNTYTKIIDGKLVGAVYARIINICLGQNTLQVPFLTGIATHPDYRYRGIAKELIAQAERNLGARGYPFIILKPFNVDFYLHLGYRPISYIKTIVCKYNGTKELIPYANKGVDKLTDKFFCLYNTVAKTNFAYVARSRDDFVELMYEHCIDGGSGALIYNYRSPKGYFLATGEALREVVIGDNNDLNRIPELDGLKAKILSSDGEPHIMAKATSVTALLNAVAYNNISLTAEFAVEDIGYTLKLINGKVQSLTQSEPVNKPLITLSDLTAIALGNAHRYKGAAPSELLSAFPTYNLYMHDEY